MRGFGRENEAAGEATLVPGALLGFRRFRLRAETMSTYCLDGSLSSDLSAVTERYSTPMLGDYIKQLRTVTVTTTTGHLTAMNASANPYRPGVAATCTARGAVVSALQRLAATATTLGAVNSIINEMVPRDQQHVAPDPKCTCGYYGYYSPALIDETGGDLHWAATAAVEVTGRVVLGTRGYRAQHHEVLALVPPEALRFTPVTYEAMLARVIASVAAMRGHRVVTDITLADGTITCTREQLPFLVNPRSLGITEAEVIHGHQMSNYEVLHQTSLQYDVGSPYWQVTKRARLMRHWATMMTAWQYVVEHQGVPVIATPQELTALYPSQDVSALVPNLEDAVPAVGRQYVQLSPSEYQLTGIDLPPWLDFASEG